MADYDVFVENTAGGCAGKWVRVTQCTYPEDARYQAEMMTGGKASTAYAVLNKGVQSSSDSEGGGCLFALLMLVGVGSALATVVAKYLPFIIIIAAIFGVYKVSKKTSKFFSEDSDEITNYLNK